MRLTRRPDSFAGFQEQDHFTMTSITSTESYIKGAERYFARTSISNPVFIDTDMIAVLDNASGTKQLALLTLSTGERTPITAYGEGLISLLGSTTSGRIVFGMDLGGNERQQLYTLGSPEDEPVRLTSDDSAFHEPGVLSAAGDAVVYRSNSRDEGAWDILVSRLESGESETWLVDGGQVTAAALDGDSALVIRNNGNMDADLLLVERGGMARNLTEHEGEQWVLAAAFSHNGAGVWMLSNIDREFVALMYQDLKSGDRKTVYESTWDVELLAPSPDGESIVLSVNENGVSRMKIIATSGDRKPVEVETPLGVIDGFSWSPDSRSVAFGISTIERPSVIMLAELDGNARVIANGDDGDPPATVTPEAIRFTSFDGREVPGLFLRPEGDGPFPVLVEIHGGPEGQRRPDYENNGPSLQYIVSLGVGVLALNVRGSTGYGKDYCHLDDRDKRLDALKDVEYAVRWLREQADVVGGKIAVYGISYGGFMTLSALVRYPELWAAGVEMVGMAHLGTFLERTGPWRRKHREGEYGSLDTDREMLDRVSPLPLVDRISVPLMVFHGQQDARVPLYESEQIVDAVRNRGLDVAFQIYEDEGHVFTKRKNLVDAFGRIGEFLTKHLQTGA
jgi:dipeptidyl aminopeptidase/acylaminoacyl peptidase